MRKEIKYIGFYDLPNGNRVFNLAATSKMNYIAEAINNTGNDVHFVSPSWLTKNSNEKSFIKGGIVEIDDCKKITYCPTFSTKRKLTRNIKIIYSLIWLFFWLIKNVKQDEKVLMYHVPWLSTPVRWAKKVRGFYLILEVEEIYGDVSVIHPYFYKLENKLIDSADAYLFSTDLLIQKIGKKKPYIVIYGAYNTYKQLSEPPSDNKIHLLYAGIIDTHKAGAFNAVEAAEFLSEKYVLHIIGFGNVDLLEKKIHEVNKKGGCQIIYDGVLSGDEYIEYCQKCHIGLSTQNLQGEYLESSFPSKILSYLGMGLNVVSGEIECVLVSSVSSLVHYYNGSPKEIANSVKTIDLKSFKQIKSEIEKLNQEFIISMKNLLS